jgi:CheY-like chemotaxis protein
MLSVSDTGSGMDRATIARVFEPFFTTKELGKGTGLGLATVQRIVEQSHGHITVDSAPGKGARFRVLLPATDDTQASPERVAEPANLDGSETILLVEQQDDVRRAAARVLRRRGYLVLEARSVREALITCESSRDPIHLLLTDVAAHHASAHELAARLRALRPTMQVLVMSGHLDSAATQPSADDIPQHFLSKPFTAEGLSRRVREVLEGAPRALLH